MSLRVLDNLFSVFSRRQHETEAPPADLTPAFRNRILMLCRDSFDSHFHGGEFWPQMHLKLQYLHGSPVLSAGAGRSALEDAIAFLQSCHSKYFLDFIEYIFQLECFWRHSRQAEEIVAAINTFFDVDDLPYFLTEYVEVYEEHPDRVSTTIRVGAYPKVILRENRFTHEEIAVPVLMLLSDPRFESANNEFLEALEDYRKGDFGDCLTKCGSAFESVLKTICKTKGWPYSPTDTTSVLLKTVLERSSLPGFFEQPLILVATIRNRLSKSHGAGPDAKEAPRHVAAYALHATASAILLVVAETR